jgi:hypothetical protein
MFVALRRVHTCAPRFPSLLLLLLLALGCRGSRNTTPPIARVDAQVVELRWGRTFDLYGLRQAGDGSLLRELVAKDQLLGTDIGIDGELRLADGTRIDDAFTLLPADPDTLQLSLLINRRVDDADFARIRDRLDDGAHEVSMAQFGQDTGKRPFPVVPRNAALRVRFDRDLGIDDGFFYTHDANGRILGVRNTVAVQLLAIVGDPNDTVTRGDFQQLPFRIAVHGDSLLLDPVLLGHEAQALQTRTTARGLPPSPDQRGANVRLAIALAGQLALPSLAARPRPEIPVGVNADGTRSVIFDFRTGHPADDSAYIARGFVRDVTPLRLRGEIPLLLERVEPIDAARQLLTVYKNDVEHRIDAGDSLRVEARDGTVLAQTEVLTAPSDSKFSQHAVVTVRRDAALAALDPAAMPGYPQDLRAREEFLRLHAPRAMLLAEFAQGDASTGGDDLSLFVAVTPAPAGGRVVADGVIENVSPFAGVVLRFNKPIDFDSVKPLETVFFATRRLLAADYDQFITAQGAERSRLSRDKFATPHLVVSDVRDATGAQTTLYLQPPLGFFFTGTMRDGPRAQRTYWLHLVSGASGLRDFAGNRLDVQATTTGTEETLAVGLALDVRDGADGRPRFADNRVVNIARRCNEVDEDEQPSIYRQDEIPLAEAPAPNARSYPLEDLFGAVYYVDGRVSARPTSRVISIADDRNQSAAPPVNTELSWCPTDQVHAPTAGIRFARSIQNPLNPYGCRLQTVWREIDLSLSRIDPNDFDLHVEAMLWAPFQDRPVLFDEFDSVSISLGHAEQRPEPCVDEGSLPPALLSGLVERFADNYAFDFNAQGGREADPRRNAPPHRACVRVPLAIDASQTVRDPSGRNTYLPLPPFNAPAFVWRDQTKLHQGGNSRTSSDIDLRRRWLPYIVSPFLGGQGRYATLAGNGRLRTNFGFWRNGDNVRFTGLDPDPLTGGLLGAIALPLLADFEVVPDEPDLPHGRGWLATGANGWQVSLTVQSTAQPNFRVYSAGGLDPQRNVYVVSPGQQAWEVAVGGRDPIAGGTTPPGDNTLYWARMHFLRQRTVATAGFVDLLDPHRMPTGAVIDPRLGPYFADTSARASLPADVRPNYVLVLSPAAMPTGTSVRVEYRAAGIVDPTPWAARYDQNTARWRDSGQEPPDAVNFPLDPRKAGDAHIRKFSDAVVEGGAWNHWIGFYNRLVTDYVDDAARLHDPAWLRQFGPPGRPLQPSDVRYVNWRLVFENNVQAQPPVSPSLESFGLAYRLESR